MFCEYTSVGTRSGVECVTDILVSQPSMGVCNPSAAQI